MKEETGNAIAGAISGAISVMIFNPIDCLRVRWQVTPRVEGDNVLSFARRVVRSEGLIRGLWAPGLLANGGSIACCSSVRFVTYVPIRTFVSRFVGGRGKKKSPATMGIAGFLAGTCGYFTVTPLFQLKTRLQVDTGVLDERGTFQTGARKGQKRAYDGTVDAITKIVRQEGWLALYRGAGPLVVRGSLLTAGHLGGYDSFKTFALSRGVEEGAPIHLMASISAAFWAVTLSNPADVIMTKWASAPTLGKRYSGVVECIRTVVRDEGIGTLYRGWSVFFLRLAPLLCVMMPIYEQTRWALGLGYST